MRRVRRWSVGLLLAVMLALPAHATVILPLLGCTLTTTGTSCNRGSTTVYRNLPLIGSGEMVNLLLDGPLGIGMVRNAGTFTAQVECQVRAGDPWLPVAGQVCSASCVVPHLPACNDVRINVTACTGCNVSVYVLKEQ